ncbi:hypothetical protein NIES37_24140 [Tolypothrix tenuis PCC 7101]|uniref:Uncharacterized protein n=1 Tax=Tolypothrix tenuis PCC 7101 TaxID=231146 RepID=A0A1Z4MYB2_9CYAN|nr:hypothetical protein [Aulosira sp. FACHB-113]BAY98464.1 hypothetical protein NIES37_24140 [Tolypothrix tenuis PCC 7101]BAZ77617.1 hypothetical protein NIES50_62480 [Aulosira laxa NIES-50]
MKQLVSQSLLGMAGATFLVCLSQPLMALVPNNVGVILNSGSTNTIGYRIYVSPTGEANYVDGNGSGKGKLPEKLTNRFFRDLKAAEPLSDLPVKPKCLKSTSFGTTTTVSLGGQQSTDISCPGNAKARRLDNDAIAIAKALKVTNVPNSKGKPLPPQNF